MVKRKRKTKSRLDEGVEGNLYCSGIAKMNLSVLKNRRTFLSLLFYYFDVSTFVVDIFMEL